MKKCSEKSITKSSKSLSADEVREVCFENLEAFARIRIQEYIQQLLEEEVAELLGRGKSERKKTVDAQPGYRNGYGKERKFTLSCGTIKVRRPRIRELEERFESRLLPLFVKRTKETADLIPELYLHGLSMGDFDLALRGLLGDDAPLSENTIARLKAKWQGEYETWSESSLKDMEVVCLWVDGIYVKAGLEKHKPAILVVIAGLSNGRKVILTVESGQRESTESWSRVLRSLKKRGMNNPRLVIGDGHLGIWGALKNVYPEADEQRCWNHRIINVLDRIPKKKQKEAKPLLTSIPYAETREEAENLKREFQSWCKRHGLDDAGKLLDDDWDRMVTFYKYPKEHWRHLRTTNIVESPFAAVRLRTGASKRFKKTENAVALIWKVLLVVEKRFQPLATPAMWKDVYNGVKYLDGKKQENSRRQNEKSQNEKEPAA